MTNKIIENHMVQNNDSKTDCEYKLVQEVEISREQEINDAIERIGYSGNPISIIEGCWLSYWLQFYADEYSSDEFIVNMIDTRVDRLDVLNRANERAEDKIRAEMRGDV